MSEKKKSYFRKKIDQFKEKQKEKNRKKNNKYFKSNTVGTRR